ncbi:hypothetical protein D6D01_10047 [Aureobasidium pullulans]|uniref:F-box domain-containing protein n=1 Tax=Aureobasidium pullulans TaxID=5580 RepID=A0A4V4JQC0_AURPU|nr:hypothetical protein D6D01_10047 [Aureobasidium pullulans]
MTTTTTTTTTPHTLLSLPSELVEQILDNVSPSTLPAVRQTCKTLASLSANSFGSKVLAQVSVVMAREALEGVLSLLSHKVFGTFVQRLAFSAAKVEERVTLLMAEIRERGFSRREARECIEGYDAAAVEQLRFIQSGAAAALLSSIFGILQGRGQVVEVGVYASPGGYGFAAAFGGLELDAWYYRSGSTLQMLIAATMSARYPPNNMAIELDDWNNGSGGDNWCFAELVGRLATAGLAGRITGGLNFSLDIGGKQMLLNTNTHSVNLRTSPSAHARQLFENYTLGFLIRRLFLPGVHGFSLCNLKINWDDLKVLIELRGANIAELEIRDVEIIRDVVQKPLIPELLKQYLPFEKMVLEDIRCSVPVPEMEYDADDEEDVVDDIIAPPNTPDQENPNDDIPVPTTNLLISGTYFFTSRPAVLAGLDDMIAARKQAENEDDERLLASLTLQLALQIYDGED